MMRRLLQYRCVCHFLFLASFFCTKLSGQSGDSNRHDPVAIFDKLPFDDPTDFSVLEAGERAEEKIANNLFVKAIINKQNVYLGEPILLQYYLYSALNNKSRILQSSMLANFNSNILDHSADSAEWKIVNGRRFRRFLVRQMQLVPFETGNLIIDPLVVENVISYSDQYGKPRSYSGNASSQPLSLTVIPLPKDSSNSFSGVIGKFRLEANIDAVNIAAKAINNLTITLSGTGNFADGYPPYIPWPANFDHFTPIIRRDVDNSIFPSQGSVIIRIPFTVQQVGEFNVPPVKLRVFDPIQKKYQDLVTLPLKLKVTAEIKSYPTAIPETEPAKLPWVYIFIAIVIAMSVGVILFLKRKSAAGSDSEPELSPTGPDQTGSEIRLYQPLFSTRIDYLEEIIDQSVFLVQLKELVLDLIVKKDQHRDKPEEEILKELKNDDPDAAFKAHKILEEVNILNYSLEGFSIEKRNRLIALVRELSTAMEMKEVIPG